MLNKTEREEEEAAADEDKVKEEDLFELPSFGFFQFVCFAFPFW